MGDTATAHAESRQRTRRLAALDGVRGLAILAVLADHTESTLGRGGFLGVDLFFVLSGYLITSILLREQAKTGRIALGRFYARRALRLYPALLVTCVAAIVLPRRLSYTDMGTELRGEGVTVTYMQDIARSLRWSSSGGPLAHTWSLAVEEHFYLVWPPILAFALARQRWGLVYGVAAVGIAWSAFVAAFQFNYRITYFRPDLRAGELLLGVLLAIALFRRPFVPPAWLGWAGLIGFAVTVWRSPTNVEHAAFLWAIPLTCVAAVAVIADLVTAPDRTMSRVLSWRPLALLGLISYGLYLYHFLVFNVLGHELSVTRSQQAPIAILVSIALAAISYRWIEQPFLRLKRRFAPPTSGAAGAVELADQQPDDRVAFLRERLHLGDGLRGRR